MKEDTRIHISTYFKPKLVQAIDKNRETFSRSGYIESLLMNILIKKEGS
jgi:hypothetical protein